MRIFNSARRMFIGVTLALLASGCGVSAYEQQYEKLLSDPELIQPEAARLKFPSAEAPTISIRLPKVIDALATNSPGLPNVMQLPPTRFLFGYQHNLSRVKAGELEVDFVESEVLKPEMIDVAIPQLMRAIEKGNPEKVEKIDFPVAGGKPLAMRYYAGTVKVATQPGVNNSPVADRKVALYFCEQAGKTLVVVWVAAPEADADARFFEAAKQSMATLVYDPNAGQKPGAKPAPGAPAGVGPAGLPAGGVLPAPAVGGPAPGAPAK